MTTSTTPPVPDVDSYPYDLGTFGLPVKTTSRTAQVWFDRALAWTYGFHHIEAERCFRYALAADPTCAMAWWGLAYAAGPNYNKAWEMFDAAELKAALSTCHDAATNAVKYASDPVEAALARAIAARFPADRLDNEKEYVKWNRAFADAMEAVYKDFGEQLDVAVVYADSLMAFAPWQLWDLATGAPKEESRTLEIQAVLEKALTYPNAHWHPGVLHFYIHLMELSPWPEKALVPADALRELIPDAGHLRHMPGHIDILIGDYRRCIDSNLDAIDADEKYVAQDAGNALDFYAFYRLHDYTFPIYAAMFNGQFKVAIDTVDRMEEGLTDEFLRIPSPPIIDWMEGFVTFRVHVLVRFGRWEDILALKFPDDRAFYCVTTTFLHYGRALALALTDRQDEALAEQALFRESRKTIVPSRQAFPNSWSDILNVAEEMLQGEILYRAGQVEDAFTHLRKSIKLCDNLVYAEPWGWMQPPRHAYAALQLEQGNVEEAAKVYAEDLGYSDALPRATRHPNNVWALHGYHECLVRLGRKAEASIIKPQLDLALAVADVQVESSCFCRRVEVGASAASGASGASCCK